jgi:quercetin dioxygenase-like cupin family protein
MKLFRKLDFIVRENPTPDKFHRLEIITGDDKARDLGGISVVLPAGHQVPYHYHERRESILILLSGEAIEVVEGKEVPIEAGDVIYLPAGEKHGVINRSNSDVRFLEFFTYPPVSADFVESGKK